MGLMVKIFAITHRGLEQISAGEMSRVPGLQVTETAYRRVHAVHHGEPGALLGLRTVDDVFLDLGTWEGIVPQRSALADLARLARKLRLQPALETVSQVRPLSPAPAFSVTANFVGKRNYRTAEIKSAVAAGISARYGWAYTEEDTGEINLRLFLEHERGYVGMRLGAAPLHRRPYKQDNLPGSLKPTIAAAMLDIAGVPPADSVLDPFCGAGTILIEAAQAGAFAYGGDSDPEALAAAQQNAARAGVSLALEPWDARSLPLDSRSAPLVVTNFPWGRQVEVSDEMEAFYRQACAEISRVLTANGQVVALTSLPHLLHFDQRHPVFQTEISLFGQAPSIVKFSVK